MFVAMYIAYPRVDHIYLGRLLPIIFNIGPRIIFWYCIVDSTGYGFTTQFSLRNLRMGPIS